MYRPVSVKNIDTTKIILLCYILFVGISYWNVLSTGRYNGDYRRNNSYLTDDQLFFNFVISSLPFIFLFIIHHGYKKLPAERYITIPVNALGVFVFALLAFQIMTRLVFGVGRMGDFEKYSAPGWIKIFIQISERFNPSFGVFVYCLSSSKKSKYSGFFVLLLIINSVLRFSLGIFVFIAFFVIIYYGKKLLYFIKKWFLLIIMLVFFFPAMVDVLYYYRGYLRSHGQITDISLVEKERATRTNAVQVIIIDRLLGRVSSYSDSAIIMERKQTMTRIVTQFPLLQYPKETLTFFSGKLSEKISYMKIMLVSEGLYSFSSNMTGTQGILLLGLYRSFAGFLINLLTILGIVFLAYRIMLLLKCRNGIELLFMYFCAPAVSGVGKEYMAILMQVILYTGFILVVNSFKKYGKSYAV